MLGNFSIGDYFRKEVIQWAFEILTSEKYFGLDKDKLYITYHPSDKETLALWIKEGMKEDHLIPLEGNFWQIGEGPCGPNTEIFYDRGEKYDPSHLGVEMLKDDVENDRYIEIWGIVFRSLMHKMVFLEKIIKNYHIKILILVPVLKELLVFFKKPKLILKLIYLCQLF